MFALLSATARAESCRVVGVSDGDTITVRCGKRDQERVRIAEIDAPEKSQPFGKAAKARASELLFGKNVDLQPNGRDRYGRVIAKVLMPDGADFGTEMIRSGLAWRYIAYSKDINLSSVESDARVRHVGLWAVTGAVAPWEFRRAKTKALKSKIRTSPEI